MTKAVVGRAETHTTSKRTTKRTTLSQQSIQSTKTDCKNTHIYRMATTMELLQATIGALKAKYGEDGGADLQIPIAELEARLAADTQKMAELAETTTTTKTKRGKRTKKERDPDRPKRGKSAFFLWCDDNRATVKAQLEGERDEDDDTKISVATVAKRLGEMWKAMSNDDKASYNDAAQIEKATYKEAIEAYNAEHGIEKKVATKSTFDPAQEENVELPEGWTGPFDGYLEKHPVDPETGKRVTRGFATFAEAFAEAERLGSACGGITLSTNTKGNRRLTLRGANQVSFKASFQEQRKEVSYLKPGGVAEEQVVEEKPEEPVVEEVDEQVVDNSKAATDSNMDADTDVDDSEEEELEVEDFEHKGVTYQKDQHGMLYAEDDEECEKVIGKVSPKGKVKIF